MPVKKSSRTSKSPAETSKPPSDTSAFATELARIRNSIHLSWNDGATTTMLVATGVAAAVMLSAALRSGKPADVTAAKVQPKIAAAQVRATNAPEETPPPPLATTPSAQLSSVTITGCLEMDNEAFRLKDTTGDVPKARGWKSGFLKKKAATIELVDAAKTMKLPDHVGERVVVTGVLVDREMQVRSLRRIAASCKQEA